MTQMQQTTENTTAATQVGAEKAALDLLVAEAAARLLEAANSNEEQVEDPAEVYFAHG